MHPKDSGNEGAPGPRPGLKGEVGPESRNDFPRIQRQRIPGEVGLVNNKYIGCHWAGHFRCVFAVNSSCSASWHSDEITRGPHNADAGSQTPHAPATVNQAFVNVSNPSNLTGGVAGESGECGSKGLPRARCSYVAGKLDDVRTLKVEGLGFQLWTCRQICYPTCVND